MDTSSLKKIKISKKKINIVPGDIVLAPYSKGKYSKASVLQVIHPYAKVQYVDKKVMFDSKKKGFNATIQSIFDFTDKNLNNYILNKKSEVYEFVDFFKFKKLLNKKKYLNSESKFIFSVISTMLFIENFNEKNL